MGNIKQNFLQEEYKPRYSKIYCFYGIRKQAGVNRYCYWIKEKRMIEKREKQPQQTEEYLDVVNANDEVIDRKPRSAIYKEHASNFRVVNAFVSIPKVNCGYLKEHLIKKYFLTHLILVWVVMWKVVSHILLLL